MMPFLQTHPFPVKAFFERSLVLTLAYPRQQVEALLPPYLTADTWHDAWAFAAVALVQTRDLRPAALPAVLGQDFFLAGYRLFTRYVTASGKRLRGLYILKSQTDRRRMTLLGNLFTHYHYETVPVRLRETGRELAVDFGTGHVTVDLGSTTEPAVPLPPHSPFADWRDARRFAGPLPFTFAYDEGRKSVVIVEGQRENWTPTPVTVRQQRLPALDALGLAGGVLAAAFTVEQIPYAWKTGRLDPWPR